MRSPEYRSLYHHAPHELKTYVDQTSRFLTTGVSNKDEDGGLHVYVRDPPKELRPFAKAVFEAAVAELSTWRRFRAPESGRVWRWRAVDDQWFFEDSPRDWRQYVSPEGQKWWWNNVNETGWSVVCVPCGRDGRERQMGAFARGAGARNTCCV